MRDETAYITAVRDTLRGLSVFAEDRQVQAEIDEMAPAITGNQFAIVMPAGVRPGRSHGTNSGARDRLYFIDVLVGVRETHKPRDRTRELGVELASTLETLVDAVIDAIDFQYAPMNAANALLAAHGDALQGFMHPLVFLGIDSRPREAAAELFGAANETRAALVRKVQFGNARRLRVRTQT